MQKKHYLVLALLLGLLLFFTLVVFWRRQTISNHSNLIPNPQPSTNQINQAPSNSTNSLSVQQFPMQPETGEENIFEGQDVLSYWLECRIEKINQYRNYDTAPLVAGGWKVIADISCSYFNSQGEAEVIYLPLHVYQPITKDYLLVGTDIQKENEERIRQTAEITSLAWYEAMTKNFWGNSVTVGKIIKIDLDFPTPELSLEKTRGAAFETLLEPDPPYTKEILNTFYQTGDASLLPKIAGKHYLWPVVRYLLK